MKGRSNYKSRFTFKTKKVVNAFPHLSYKSLKKKIFFSLSSINILCTKSGIEDSLYIHVLSSPLYRKKKKKFFFLLYHIQNYDPLHNTTVNLEYGLCAAIQLPLLCVVLITNPSSFFYCFAT